MKDIIFNPLLKLSNVNRYSGVYLLKPESVSDHTTQVGLIAILIGNELNKRISKIGVQKVKLEDLALKALVHDIDEASSADIPRNVKYANARILKQFKALEDSAVASVSEQFEFDELYEFWTNSKDASLEGRIVKLADLLSVVRKTVDEVVILSNKNMLRVAVEVIEQVNQEKAKALLDKQLHSDIIEFFAEIYETAADILTDIIKNNQTEISDFYFKSQS